jgi:hypothetical protein
MELFSFQTHTSITFQKSLVHLTYFFKLSTVLSLFCVVEGSENNSKILIQLSSCPRQGNFENMTVSRKELGKSKLVDFRAPRSNEV